jgi:hypothetical protein
VKGAENRKKIGRPGVEIEALEVEILSIPKQQ